MLTQVLPNELNQQILGYCDIPEIVAISETDQYLHSQANDDAVWRAIAKKIECPLVDTEEAVPVREQVKRFFIDLTEKVNKLSLDQLSVPYRVKGIIPTIDLIQKFKKVIETSNFDFLSLSEMQKFGKGILENSARISKLPASFLNGLYYSTLGVVIVEMLYRSMQYLYFKMPLPWIYVCIFSAKLNLYHCNKIFDDNTNYLQLQNVGRKIQKISINTLHLLGLGISIGSTVLGVRGFNVEIFLMNLCCAFVADCMTYATPNPRIKNIASKIVHSIGARFFNSGQSQ